MSLKNKRRFLLAALLIFNIFLVFYVIRIDSDETETGGPKANLEEGKALAKKYCQSCHLLPNPSLLPKEMWETGVMPSMGPFFGFKSFKGQLYHQINDVDPSTFPANPIIDSLEWQLMVDYFVQTAPDFLQPHPNKIANLEELPFFNIELPHEASFYGKVSMTSYVKIDTSVNPHRILVSDAMDQKFYVLNPNLKLLSSVKTPGPIVDIVFQNKILLACNIGNDVEANNLRNGTVLPLEINAQQIVLDAKPFFNKLARPVKITQADLNIDGRTDYVISQFGNVIGDLSWREGLANGQFKIHILRNKPGVLTTIVKDSNKDGKPDIWALFAQGDEGIFLYTNNGNGEMKERQVLRFPPSYGSTSFDLVDFNKDGFLDIIYTCGDNADYTPVLKPYHGVYIYLNNGKNNFKQDYFYPINGCYKAIARDFDKDGLVDIATISFFPSAKQPEEAFIYLQNKGNNNFKPYKLPVNTPFEKGITMDAADLDGDGKQDILIGNGFYNSNETDNRKQPLFIILKNKS
jgi:hypothetical protein